MNDQLLIKYLLNETTEEENFLVEQWLGAHPDHQKKYKQMQWVWERSKITLQNSKVDENLAWQKFKARKKNRSSKTIKFFPFWLRGVAAAFAILAIGWITLSFMPHTGRAYFTNVVLETENISKKEILLDGTFVTLNKNSRLSYAQKIFSGERQAHLLEGEAYFEVQKNDRKPFYIQADDLTLRVIGTSFNVKIQENRTEVILEEGSVSVHLGDQSLVLEPGQKVSTDNKNKSLIISPIDNHLYRYYLNNKFEAQDIPLYQIIEALNKAYDASITIASEDLKSRKITTTLEYGSLDQNLEVIKETLRISISGEGKEKVIY